ncbi:MAG: hypothetical protein IT385_03050 [Deltaproteobacteria bacterium]|nr:hypothetical protein [Deltaproteobacteria bacterium]
MTRVALVCWWLATACEARLPPPAFDGGVTDTRVAETATSEEETLATVWCREHEGDILIESRESFDTDYWLVRKLIGSVVSRSPEGFWNPDMREVTGDFVVDGTPAAPVSAHIGMASLRDIGGDLRVRHTQRGLLDFGRLEHLGGRFDASHGRWVIHLPKLLQLDGLELHDATIDHLDLRSLHTSLGPVRVVRVEGLTELALPALATIGGPGDALVIDGVAALARLDLSSLARVSGNVRVTNNPMLTRTVIHDALDGVVVSGELVICGNAGETPCP